MTRHRVSRRRLLQSASAATAFSIVPAFVLGKDAQDPPPSQRLNIATIGLGWPGCKDSDALASTNNIVALCDVDSTRAPDFRKKYPKARSFVDYRRMFDEMEKEIDAVIVATPDHTHAVLAIAAMKRGKHVYCEKPLAHSICEVRQMMKAARDNKVVTQMGNQGHSSESIRLFCEWVWDGAIGDVHTIHAGCRSVNSALDKLAAVEKEQPPVPENLNWDLWLGPAKQRPYHPAYLHEKWRGWVPFGNGTLGDWTCHVIDPVFWALELGAPTSVIADVKDYDPRTQGDAFPKGDVITFEFPARKTSRGPRGPVKLVWHSGTERIPRPEMLEPERKPVDTGAIVYGEKGAIMYGSHGAGGVRLIPETAMKAYKQPTRTLERVPRGGHELDWATAIRNGRKAGSDVAYGGPLTEIALVGVIALKFPGTRLSWDSMAMKFANSDAANTHVNPPCRENWTL